MEIVDILSIIPATQRNVKCAVREGASEGSRNKAGQAVMGQIASRTGMSNTFNRKKKQARKEKKKKKKKKKKQV